MADDKLAELLKTQKSLTEWFQDIKHKDADLIRREDNEKRERLKILNKVIKLPFDKPTQFEATELKKNSAALQAYIEEHGNDLCALRLIPKAPALPKLRMRGRTVRQAIEWFHEQKINSKNYRADFIPHTEDSAWATIFIVNKHGIQGEIIYGGHHQLTQGFHETAKPSVFHFDYEEWTIYPDNNAALAHLRTLAEYLYVGDIETQRILEKELGATFSHGYLEGYFETSDSSAGTWFIDYSPTLGKLYGNIVIPAQAAKQEGLVSGMTGCGGVAEGLVRIVGPDDIGKEYGDEFILVCSVTTPNYVPLMQKAKAIVTDQGGILSHAAIIARELKKPCIVATGNATTALHNGQRVTVDANTGVVKNYMPV